MLKLRFNVRNQGDVCNVTSRLMETQKVAICLMEAQKSSNRLMEAQKVATVSNISPP
jgi:hypothetical protein